MNDFIFNWSPRGRRFYKLCKIVHEKSTETIRKRRQQIKDAGAGVKGHGGKYLDFLDILLAARVTIEVSCLRSLTMWYALILGGTQIWFLTGCAAWASQPLLLGQLRPFFWVNCAHFVKSWRLSTVILIYMNYSFLICHILWHFQDGRHWPWKFHMGQKLKHAPISLKKVSNCLSCHKDSKNV